MQIIAGMGFTFMSLIIISGSTKKADTNNLTTKINQPVLETDDEPYH